MVLESSFFLSSNVCVCMPCSTNCKALVTCNPHILTVHTYHMSCMFQSMNCFFFFFFNVARYKVISFYYKMFEEDLWIGRLKEQISISNHLEIGDSDEYERNNNPAVKTTRNHWSSLFLVQRLVPSTTTIPSPTKKRELWQLGWRQDSILTLWYNNRKTRRFSNQASRHLLNYWSFTMATLMPRREKRKEKYLYINNQKNLQKTEVSMQPSTQASSSQENLFSDFQVLNIILGFLS